MAADAPALAVDDLTKSFGGLLAVDGASFEVADGSFTGIVGPNGAGKSTVFNLISGLLAPDDGAIRLHGREVQGLSTPERAHAGLGRTFQTPRLFDGMTVRDNLRFAAADQTGESIAGALFRSGAVADEEAAITERADEVLAFLELDHLADEYARGLSGGQQKLLELGRALMLDPAVLLLDEPVAGVNPTLTNDIVERLHDVNDDGTTVVVIEHDMDLIMDNCEEVVVLVNGSTLATGDPAVIREDQRVLDSYLGGGGDG